MLRRRPNQAEERGAEQDPRHELADYSRLAEALGRLPEQAGGEQNDHHWREEGGLRVHRGRRLTVAARVRRLIWQGSRLEESRVCDEQNDDERATDDEDVAQMVSRFALPDLILVGFVDDRRLLHLIHGEAPVLATIIEKLSFVIVRGVTRLRRSLCGR